MYKFSQFEKDLGYTTKSVNEDIFFSAIKQESQKEKELEDLFRPLREAHKRNAEIDRERAKNGIINNF
jgi:transcriptional accessory protein Tex/SPT6